MVDFPQDNRFPTPGVDARFSTPGVDWRFKDAPVDNRFPSPGVDRRWTGDPWNYTAPAIVEGPTWTPTSAEMGNEFTLDVGSAAGTPAPTATVVVYLDGFELAPIAPNVWLPALVGDLVAFVTWSNGVAPDAEATVTAVSLGPPEPEPEPEPDP